MLMSRFWTGSIHVVVGGECTTIQLDNGTIAGMSDAPLAEAGATDVVITASPDAWTEMLATIPRPMYHDLHAAARYHDVEISGDTLTTYQYYPALRRFLEIARDSFNGR